MPLGQLAVQGARPGEATGDGWVAVKGKAPVDVTPWLAQPVKDTSISTAGTSVRFIATSLKVVDMGRCPANTSVPASASEYPSFDTRSVRWLIRNGLRP